MSPDLLAGPVTVNLLTGVSTGNGNDTLVAIEAASGSTGDGIMTGNAEDNDFVALFEGSDTVDAGPGDDVVDSGEAPTTSTAVPAWISSATSTRRRA